MGKNSADANGLVTVEDQTVIYVYKKIEETPKATGTITVIYKTDKDKVLGKEFKEDLPVGDPYTTEIKTFEDITL